MSAGEVLSATAKPQSTQRPDCDDARCPHSGAAQTAAISQKSGAQGDRQSTGGTVSPCVMLVCALADMSKVFVPLMNGRTEYEAREGPECEAAVSGRAGDAIAVGQVGLIGF